MAGDATAAKSCPSCVADFALYDPSYEDDGVWEEEITALKAMMDAYDWSYQIVDPSDLNSKILGSGDSRRFRALIAPGGYAYYRVIAVNPEGDAAIRGFVRSGGGYVGFCAGAYWAVDTVRWSQTGNGTIDYPYDLHLFRGVGQGPFGWMPWMNGTNANLDVAAINSATGVMQKIGMPPFTRFLYGGGPWFLPDESLPHYEVWARAAMPAGTLPSHSNGNGKPSVIRFSYGDGAVVLFSYHPDVLIHSNVDHVKLSVFYKEDQIRWITGNQSWPEINLNSWNIVHAAFQTAINEPVTRLTKLPSP